MYSPDAPNPMAAPPANPAATIQLRQQPKPLQKFINGEPKALGVTLIMLGIIQFGFGVPLRMANVSEITAMGTPWWLTVLVTACLATNIITAIATGIAIVIYCADLSSWHIIYHKESESVIKFLRLSYGIKTVLLFFTVSGAVLNIVLSVFCCKGLRYCSPSTSMPVVVVHNPFSENPTCSSTMPAY